jgi:hypothetical protein
LVGMRPVVLYVGARPTDIYPYGSSLITFHLVNLDPND